MIIVVEIRTINKSNFGSVSLVKNKQTGKIYVKKDMNISNEVIKNNNSEDSAIVKIIQKKFISPFLIKIPYYKIEQGVLSIIMEYCSGGSLRDQIYKRIKMKKPFTNSV